MKNKALQITGIRRHEINDYPDLKWIIARRSLFRFLNTYFPEANGSLKGLKGKIVDIEEEKIEQKFKPLLDKEIDYFINNELSRYQRKNNSDYLKDIERARDEGNNSSLFNLLEWDKAWLKMDWVVEKIIQAQNKDNFDFLKSVGETIAKQPGSSTKPMKEKNVMQDVKLLCDLLGIRREDHDLIKDLHYRLFEAGTISDKKADYNYFVKWLSRHRII